MIFEGLNGGGNTLLDGPMAALSTAGAAYVVVLAAPLLWARGRHASAVDYLLLFIAVEVASFALKLALQVPRPTPPRPVPWVPAPLDPSFPSGHAARTFALAAFLGSLEGRWRLPPFAFATAVAVSRVYLGAHLPSEVVAGAVLGVGIALSLLAVGRHPGYLRWRRGVVGRIEGLLAKLLEGPQGVQHLSQGGEGGWGVPCEG